MPICYSCFSIGGTHTIIGLMPHSAQMLFRPILPIMPPKVFDSPSSMRPSLLSALCSASLPILEQSEKALPSNSEAQVKRAFSDVISENEELRKDNERLRNLVKVFENPELATKEEQFISEKLYLRHMYDKLATQKDHAFKAAKRYQKTRDAANREKSFWMAEALQLRKDASVSCETLNELLEKFKINEAVLKMRAEAAENAEKYWMEETKKLRKHMNENSPVASSEGQ